MRSESILRRLRKERGLKLSELALLLGVSVSSVCEWELGLQIPSDNRLAQLADLYDVPFMELKKEVMRYAEKKRKEILEKIRANVSGEPDLSD